MISTKLSTPPIILASGSKYRQTLLQKLAIDFETASPSIDESPKSQEPPAQLAVRLGQQKAQALKSRYPKHLIIGSDQVAYFDGCYLEKPGTRDRAIRQLHSVSGRQVEFFTSICVLNSTTGEYLSDLDTTTVLFKPLTSAQIESYLDRDEPYDCAGSFKAESLGIALFEKINSEDPNALIGLPLIKLIKLLAHFNVNIL